MFLARAISTVDRKWIKEPFDATDHGEIDPHMKGDSFRELIRRYKGDTQFKLHGFIRGEVLKQATTFPVDESDIFAVSFPKSGI